MFLKYWSSSHFLQDVFSYCTKLELISLGDATTKEDLHSWFHGVDYEEGFGPYEMPHTEVNKILIYNYAIVSAINREERKGIFGEDGALEFFFVFLLTCVIVFCK